MEKKPEDIAKVTFKTKMMKLFHDVKDYLNPMADLESQTDIEESIRSGVSFKGSQLLTLIFAIFIASLGLNTNSIPVIIGAMLISPLMGPIIGMGLGIGIRDFTLLKRSLKNVTAAIIGSLITSAIYFMISPQYEGSSQLLARTSPSIYDVLIAFFGGAAGILSIAAKNKGQVMPGVAIATSLMPPLCTAGYGLATLQMNFFLGAFYLFFTNLMFIFVASWIGIKLFGFKNVVYQNVAKANRVRAIVYIVVTLMIALSVYLTVIIIQKNIFLDRASKFVENEMVFPNTQVLNSKEYVESGKQHIDVTLIGEALPIDSLKLALINKMDSCGLGGTILNIKQGFALNQSGLSEDDTEKQFYEIMQSELTRQQSKVDSLRSLLDAARQYGIESKRIAPEIKVLFPAIKDIALSQMVASSISNNRLDSVNMIFINAPAGLSQADRTKLEKYIGVRLNDSNLNLIVNPSGFPWPSDTAE